MYVLGCDTENRYNLQAKLAIVNETFPTISFLVD